MRILITGAAGQLGTELQRQLQNGQSALGAIPPQLLGAEVTGADLADGDLSVLAEARALVQRAKPDVVFNCAAFTNVDAAETQPDDAFAANALAPRNLAVVCEETGAKLVHVSTDYVFSGAGEVPFAESDLPRPASVYGKTKLLGEEYVRGFCRRWFIARTSWLYGRTGGNFVKTMLRLVQEQPEVRVVDDQRGNPTNAEDLAHHLLRLAATEEYGLYHITGGGVCTWYAFACEIARLAGAAGKIAPCTTAEFPRPAKRPQNSALEHTMLRRTIGDEMRPWQQALAQYIEELRTNP
ncbi:dTDP-4-dehydrorhamnose reductase [Ruminococcaceae bacterium OttesenSCG-928-O06]|nr:dTDP-4-dehydrorhamnose reductase [Ruminococcaceae bacterium OttesenSCG-928-O06]